LAAELRPDPLAELKHSPRPHSRNAGPTSTGQGGEGRGNRKKREMKGERKGRGEEGQGLAMVPPNH